MVEVVADLIKGGADVNEKNNQTALHSAAANGQHALAQLLLSAEAKVNVKDDPWGRRTPLGSAKARGWEGGHREVEALLLQHGAE